MCPPLDTNSRYCNLLQVSHFADTAILAEDSEGQLIGAVTGYRKPRQQSTLFIWQVAVHAAARGQKLGMRMLLNLISRVGGVTNLETTVTPDNKASRAMFKALAGELGAPLKEMELFHKDRHFAGEHDTEVLLRIGPFRRS